MSDISPRLELPLLQPAQAQKHVTHNEALRILDIFVQLTVEEFDASVPPASPQEGLVYAIGAGGSGAWFGADGLLATWVDGAWQFHTPTAGWIAAHAATSEVRVFTGSVWSAVTGGGAASTQNLAGVGVNTTSDLTNRLSVVAPATLLNHEGSGHQLKINKAAPGDTGSVLFQTGFSGRAEFGLTGDDDFSVKLSADGSTWVEALRLAPGDEVYTTSNPPPRRELGRCRQRHQRERQLHALRRRHADVLEERLHRRGQQRRRLDLPDTVRRHRGGGDGDPARCLRPVHHRAWCDDLGCDAQHLHPGWRHRASRHQRHGDRPLVLTRADLAI